MFTKKDFVSDNGMSSAVWGPLQWHMLHTMSFNYPVRPTKVDKDHYKEHLLSLKYVLPCVYCRNNFMQNLTKANFTDAVFANRDTYSRFIYKLHNCVNTMLKKTIKISYNEVRVRYEHFRARCSEKKVAAEIAKEQHEAGKESGCNSSLHGAKSRCVVYIVPNTSKRTSFRMDAKCNTHHHAKATKT
jgi:hypothetical protein